jgi:hypothetical protein
VSFALCARPLKPGVVTGILGQIKKPDGARPAAARPRIWEKTVKWDRLLVTTWRGTTNWVRQESAAATALIQAFIALGIAFTWWHWSNAQTGAVIGIVSALLGMFVRSQVTPTVRPRDGGRELIAPDAPATKVEHPEVGSL